MNDRDDSPQGGTGNGSPEARQHRPEERIAELTAERDRLKAELAELQEKHMTLEQCYATLAQELFPFDEEQIREIRESGVTLDQVIAELEQEMGS